VVAAGNEHGVAVYHGHRLVQRTVLGVDPLQGEALRRLLCNCSDHEIGEMT
jgi:hypothetical protein